MQLFVEARNPLKRNAGSARGITIEGEGSGTTFIKGVGAQSVVLPNKETATFYITLLAGDTESPTLLSGVTLLPGSPQVFESSTGVFCDRGSLEPDSLGNVRTAIDSVVEGPDYDYGIFASSSATTSDSACHLVVTRSKLIHGHTGIWAEGCAPQSTTGQLSIYLNIGDNSRESGNEIAGMRFSDKEGVAVSIRSCVSGAIQNNRFADNAFGVVVAAQAGGTYPASHFEFAYNEFLRNSADALLLAPGPYIVDSVVGNTIADGFWGFVLDNGWELVTHVVKNVRRNVIVGNQVGVQIALGESVLRWQKSNS